jgi:hypothetical protein
MKIFAIISIVIVLLLGCCGGCVYTGYYMMYYGTFEPVKVQIDGTPTIDQYIGTIDSGTLSWENSMADWSTPGNEQRMTFDVSGPKGTGLVTISQGTQGLNKLDWATLEIDGETHVILGTPPADLDAEPSSADSDPASDSNEKMKSAPAENTAEMPAETAPDKE